MIKLETDINGNILTNILKKDKAGSSSIDDDLECEYPTGGGAVPVPQSRTMASDHHKSVNYGRGRSREYSVIQYLNNEAESSNTKWEARDHSV